VAELLLEQPVDAPRLLLGAQLQAVVRRLALAGLAVHARRERPALDGALGRVAALTLEVELGALPATEAADRARVIGHYTRLRFGSRHPLCGMGVTSVMALTSRPVACSERIAASRPAPGPRTNTSMERMPCSSALLAVASAVCCAAKGVDLRLPLKPCAPAEPQEMTLPSMSVMEMIVLLNVLWMWACPWTTFLRSRRRVRTTFFLATTCLPSPSSCRRPHAWVRGGCGRWSGCAGRARAARGGAACRGTSRSRSGA